MSVYVLAPQTFQDDGTSVGVIPGQIHDLEGHAVDGMSGGGLFDDQGRQVGILVRASFAGIGVQYVRAVRMSYLVARIEATLASLAQEDQEAVRPYLESR